MELQEIISKMESEGWEIENDFKIAHGHFLQYFLETVEQALRIHDVVGRSEQLLAFLEWVDKSPEENANRSREDLVEDYLSQ